MSNRGSRKGCFLWVGSVGIILILLFGIGTWWFFRLRYPADNAIKSSPVQVFVLSPSSGEQINSGDYVSITVQAVAPSAIQSIELFVDGKSHGIITDSPETAFWSWQAWPAGIHTLSVGATSADGQAGKSQTVIITVLDVDGMIHVPAEEGQTLGQIGAGFGLDPEQVADANPQIDPSQPLPEGQPVQVPTGGGGNSGGAGSDNGSGPGGEANSSGLNALVPFLINWQFQPKEPVDKSYCYTSNGNGKWEKIPKKPFEFFKGAQVNYPQYEFELLNEGEVIIQVQCWAWLGDKLKFLGQGEKRVNTVQPATEVMISGEGFQLVGMPQFNPKPEKLLGGGLMAVPPPYAVREANSFTECQSHGVDNLACSLYYSANVIQNVLLIWEWQSEICWPGYCKYGIDKIDGYRLFELDPLTNTEVYLKEITNPGQRVALLPLPWGYKCFGVRAFVNDPAIEDSEMATYCPGQPPQPEKIVLDPSDWLTTGGQWIQDGDCDTYGNGDAYVIANQKSGFGKNGEVLVGSYIVDDEDADCFRQGDYSAGIKFGEVVLPPGAVIQKSILKFSGISTDYGASGVATNFKLFCVGVVGKAKQNWTGLVTGNHFQAKNILFSSAYNQPYSSISGWDDTPDVDVTSIVKQWHKQPSQNHGFILTPRSAPHPIGDGAGSCESSVGNFQLEIYYFTAPN